MQNHLQAIKLIRLDYFEVKKHLENFNEQKF